MASAEAPPGAAGESRALAAQLRALEEQADPLPCCLATVRQMAALLRDAAHRETATENLFQKLLQILRKASHEIDGICWDASTLSRLDYYLLLLSECFRCLRNACVQCANHQNVMRSLGLIDESVHLIQLLQKFDSDMESLLTAHLESSAGEEFYGYYALPKRQMNESRANQA